MGADVLLISSFEITVPLPLTAPSGLEGATVHVKLLPLTVAFSVIVRIVWLQIVVALGVLLKSTTGVGLIETTTGTADPVHPPALATDIGVTEYIKVPVVDGLLLDNSSVINAFVPPDPG